MNKDFFKFKQSDSFFNKSFLNEKRTVCVLHDNGTLTEHHNITNPWKYIVKVKKQIGVKNCWIKNENN